MNNLKHKYKMKKLIIIAFFAVMACEENEVIDPKACYKCVTRSMSLGIPTTKIENSACRLTKGEAENLEKIGTKTDAYPDGMGGTFTIKTITNCSRI